jgi:hypothetical protein
MISLPRALRFLVVRVAALGLRADPAATLLECGSDPCPASPTGNEFLSK